MHQKKQKMNFIISKISVKQFAEIFEDILKEIRQLEKFINIPEDHKLNELDQILGRYRVQNFDQIQEVDTLAEFLNIDVARKQFAVALLKGYFMHLGLLPFCLNIKNFFSVLTPQFTELSKNLATYTSFEKGEINLQVYTKTAHKLVETFLPFIPSKNFDDIQKPLELILLVSRSKQLM